MSLRRGVAAIVVLGIISALAGCSEAPSANEIKQAPVSYKTRVENAHARIDKSYRLSETETVKIVIVPGHPYGERCVIYTNGQSSTMHCREIAAQQQ